MMSFPNSMMGMMLPNQAFGLFAGSAFFWPFLVWMLAWKGLALWAAARRGHNIWFIVFLIVNTAGVGEIIYLLATDGFSEFKKKK